MTALATILPRGSNWGSLHQIRGPHMTRLLIILIVLSPAGCIHYWGGVEQGEVHFSEFMSSLGPDVPIQMIIDTVGPPKHHYTKDDLFDIYLFHLIENSAWDGIPGPTAEAGVALLVERNTGRVRDTKVTFEKVHRYPGWEAFMAGLAAGRYRSHSIACTGTTIGSGSVITSSVFCTGW